MKNQALFSSKDKSKKLKCRLLQVLFGALRVKKWFFLTHELLLFYKGLGSIRGYFGLNILGKLNTFV